MTNLYRDFMGFKLKHQQKKGKAVQREIEIMQFAKTLELKRFKVTSQRVHIQIHFRIGILKWSQPNKQMMEFPHFCRVYEEITGTFVLESKV